nr:MAG TPA: hypothetical protein [Caudoviricetes sp.]
MDDTLEKILFQISFLELIPKILILIFIIL